METVPTKPCRLKSGGCYMPWLEEKHDHLILNIKVLPRSSKDEITGLMGEMLNVRIQAPPVDGQANVSLIKFLSKHWKVPRANIELLSGETGHTKRIRISHVKDEWRERIRHKIP